MRAQAKSGIFRENGPVTATKALLKGAHMAFYRVPTEFLMAIDCALKALPLLALLFHGTHIACTALSRRSHCADGVLKTFVCTILRSVYKHLH